MFRVYSCIAHEHNLLLVLVAGFVCILSAFTALSAFLHADQEPSRRKIFIVVAALVSGLGIWATHFIAMLAYEPGLAITYDVPRTLLSATAAVLISGLGWTVALGQRPAMAPIGGAIIGGGVATMHYLGMSAVQLDGDIAWDRGLVWASIILGVGLAAAAVWLHRRRPRDPALVAAPLLALAICSLHFVSMAAAVIYPHQGHDVASQSVDSQTLAIIVTLAALLIMGMGTGLVLFDRRRTEDQLVQAQQRAMHAEEILRGAEEREKLTSELKYQAEISAAALDNMAQGLSMYDAQDRLVTHNRRYVELYEVPEELLTPGTPFAEIAKRMIDYLGVPPTSQDADIPTPHDDEWSGEHELTLPNGRIVKYDRRPLPGGGWVATHEDVTDARRTHQQIAYLAAHDTLTGLPNRTTFSAHLEAYARGGKPFCGSHDRPRSVQGGERHAGPPGGRRNPASRRCTPARSDRQARFRHAARR
jgi:NO-binding membrane sensor protein with MHYT domain